MRHNDGIIVQPAIAADPHHHGPALHHPHAIHRQIQCKDARKGAIPLPPAL